MVKWFRSLFAWKEIRDSGVWLYLENSVTSQRKAIRFGGGFQPLDHNWLNRTCWNPSTPPPSARDDE